MGRGIRRIHPSVKKPSFDPAAAAGGNDRPTLYNVVFCVTEIRNGVPVGYLGEVFDHAFVEVNLDYAHLISEPGRYQGVADVSKGVIVSTDGVKL
jgi:hypothetical protein